MVVLSEKHAVKIFEKSLSSAFFAVCPLSCSRILVQSMVQVYQKIFFSFASFLQTSFLEFALFGEKLTFPKPQLFSKLKKLSPGCHVSFWRSSNSDIIEF